MFSYTSKPEESDFFIQLKGENAGKPIKDFIPNSIGVRCDPQHLHSQYFYYLILNLFMQGKFKERLRGSVVPFLRLSDITTVIIDFLYR